VTDDKPRTRALVEVFTTELAGNKPPLVLNAATQQAFKQTAERHRTMVAAFAQPAANSYARMVTAGMLPALAAHLRNSQALEDLGKIAGLAAAGMQPLASRQALEDLGKIAGLAAAGMQPLASRQALEDLGKIAGVAAAGMQPLLATYLRNSQVFEDVGKIASLATAGSAAVALANAMRALSPPRTDWSNLVETINNQANPIDQISVGRWEPHLPIRVRLADPPTVPETPAQQPTTPEPTEPYYDWRSDPRVGLAVLVLGLCITLTVSTYFVLGPDAWHELRDDTSWYLTVVLAVLAGLNGTHRR
jgi:hypothetical protein